jgi:hypothetical protein
MREALNGEWIGEGAKPFVLSGALSDKPFEALRQNRNLIKGESLSARDSANWGAVFDIQLSAPKDVKILTMVGCYERVRLVFVESVRSAVAKIERFPAVREFGVMPWCGYGGGSTVPAWWTTDDCVQRATPSGLHLFHEVGGFSGKIDPSGFCAGNGDPFLHHSAATGLESFAGAVVHQLIYSRFGELRHELTSTEHRENLPIHLETIGGHRRASANVTIFREYLRD